MLDWLFTNDPGAAARRNAYPTQYRPYQGPSPARYSDPGAAARRNAYPTQYREHYDGQQEQYDDYQEPQEQSFHQQPQPQPQYQPSYSGGEVHVQRKEGHFFVQCMIADVAFMAMIDSGASNCKISHKVMHELGADLRGVRWNSEYTVGNGQTTRALTVPLDLTVMGIERSGVACAIKEHDAGGPLANLIGMSFLSTLSSCEQRGGLLIMRP